MNPALAGCVVSVNPARLQASRKAWNSYWLTLQPKATMWKVWLGPVEFFGVLNGICSVCLFGEKERFYIAPFFKLDNRKAKGK